MNDSSFRTLNERDLFQMSLPSPWNVRITSTSKHSEEMSTIKSAFGKSEQKFKGKGSDYFAWRAEANQFINQANIPIATKIIALKDACVMDKDPLLSIIFSSPTKKKETYKSIIKMFEQFYGGSERASRYITAQLQGCKKLNTSDYISCANVYSILDKFIQHSQIHGEEDSLKQKVLVQKVFEHLLTPAHVRAIKRDKQQGLLHRDENSVYIIVEWLKKIIDQWDYVHDKLPVESLRQTSTSTSAARPFARRRPFIKPRATTMLAEAAAEEEEELVEDPYEVDDGYYLDDANSTELDASEEADSGSFPSPGVELSSSVGEDEMDCDHLGGLVEADAANYAFLVKHAMKGRQYVDCGYCKKAKKGNVKHPIWRCAEFQKLTPASRRTWINTDKRCSNCLSPAHATSACESVYKCRVCDKKHSTLLHDPSLNAK